MPTVDALMSKHISNATRNKETWGGILYNVKDFGAKGDGVTDDTAAIQDTIDTAISEGGKLVFFPHGSYKITSLTNTDQVILSGDNATFVGTNIEIEQFGKKQQHIKDVSLADVKFIAHRGLSGIAPENTLPAYEWAGKVGLWGGECDIQTTSDGEWILMHDATVDRTTDGTGNVSDLTLAQIKALTVDAGSNIDRYPNLKVPTLSEYLLTCKKFNLVPVMEIKSGTYTSTNYDDFITLIKENGFEESCVVISFDLLILQEVRSRSSKIKIQYLADISVESIDNVLALENADIDISTASATQENIEYAHSRGVKVNIWTIDSYQDAKTYIGYGVDYITTNIIAGVI